MSLKLKQLRCITKHRLLVQLLQSTIVWVGRSALCVLDSVLAKLTRSGLHISKDTKTWANKALIHFCLHTHTHVMNTTTYLVWQSQPTNDLFYCCYTSTTCCDWSRFHSCLKFLTEENLCVCTFNFIELFVTCVIESSNACHNVLDHYFSS